MAQVSFSLQVLRQESASQSLLWRRSVARIALSEPAVAPVSGKKSNLRQKVTDLRPPTGQRDQPSRSPTSTQCTIWALVCRSALCTHTM